MVQDFTNIGAPSKPEDELDHLADAIRTGKPPRASSSQPPYQMTRQREEALLALDAPTKFWRQVTAGGFELLALLKYGLGFMVFLIPTALGGYILIFGRFEPSIFYITAACLAISIFLARKTLHAVKIIRTIVKA